jgi:hypothetical protein
VKILSNDGAIWQNIHLMGFGTLNPEPSPVSSTGAASTSAWSW